ncbi:Dephospho-CoA kinase [Buchnera aphidicola (Eriosoma grossulariae)]|uniref:dephospho-CoA kinase n=1 Tax=Buchnera aphidicola TaxID=9 RepID=UPI0034645B35
MTYVVALTGGIGSGKSTISNAFKNLGIDVIDSDLIGKNIIKSNKTIIEAIIKKFGSNILQKNGCIDRLTLRKKIFNYVDNRVWLEKILHPYIHIETKKQINASKSIWCLWVTPLLIEKKLYKSVDRILVVDVPIKVQIERTIKRDNIKKRLVKKILKCQTTRKKRLSLANDIINNNINQMEINLYINYLNLSYKILANKKIKKKHKKLFD